MSHEKSVEDLKTWLQTYSKYINSDDLKDCLLYEHEASRLNKIAAVVYQHLIKLQSSANKPPTVIKSPEPKPQKPVEQVTTTSSNVLPQILDSLPDKNTTLTSIANKISCGKINNNNISHRDIETIVNYLNSSNIITSDEASYLLRNKDTLDVEGTLRRALQECLFSNKKQPTPKDFLHDPRVLKYINSIADKHVRSVVVKLFSRNNKVVATKKDILYSLRLLVVSLKTKQPPTGIVAYVSNIIKNILAYVINSNYTKENLTNDVTAIEKLIETIGKI